MERLAWPCLVCGPFQLLCASRPTYGRASVRPRIDAIAHAMTAMTQVMMAMTEQRMIATTAASPHTLLANLQFNGLND